MKRRFIIGFLIAVIALTVAVPVLAYLYRAPLTIASNYTDYTGLAVTCTADVDWLITNGFITTSTALDTRVETLGGTAQKHMMAEDRIMVFCPTLAGYSQLNWYLTTGNTALTSFPVIVGNDGYVTITDHADLELGVNNFSLEWDGYINTNTAGNLTSKEDVFLVASDGVGHINATIYGRDDITELDFTGWELLWGGGKTRASQRVDDIPVSNITGISFWLKKTGAPLGTAYIRVREVVGDAILGTMGSIDVTTLGGGAWYDFTGSIYNPTEQDLRFTCEWDGVGDIVKNVGAGWDNAGGTEGVRSYYDGVWNDQAGDDTMIKIYFGDATVGAAVTAGVHNITVASNGTDLKIYEDSVEEDYMTVIQVVDNANAWR